MNKEQSHKLVKDTFENSFNRDNYKSFIINLLNEVQEAAFTYQGNTIPDAFKQYISKLERIVKYTDGENKLDVLIAYLKKETSIERARTMQRNFIAWYLNGSRGGELKDAALVAFVSPDLEEWRFSLVKMDYKIDEKGKVKEKVTPARRWSFLVGKNESSHTAQSRFIPIIEDDKNNPSLQVLEEAFNIEKVTKEFFEKYRELYLKTKECLDNIISDNKSIKDEFKSKGIETADFTKKLLGQIVFLYFLQKKGWFGVSRGAEWGTGEKSFLRHLYDKKNREYDSFFNDLLEPLFYNTLATDRGHEAWCSFFECRIPFLNGGLFEPLNNYDWKNNDVLLPNTLFHNDIETKNGDKGTGIFDIFDRYNFTVCEDEPLEKEVAVDPEMLGKVFENLLEVKDRKSKGTYYTPREIVHYMCQESLISYLDTSLNKEKELVSRGDIEVLVRIGEQASHYEDARMSGTKSYKPFLPASIEMNAKLIDKKLAAITTCDPAVGSGAFLVGMMTEIVRIRCAITPYFNDIKERSSYYFKRHAIQNCLYGVDIDLGSVEIAKLRLWLSLLVDEEDIDNIKPLPNLDYKIVNGNSLHEIEQDMLNADLFDELEKIKNLFFDETNSILKQDLKNIIDGLIKKITRGNREFDFNVYFSEIFHEKHGFDIIIGNPPYVRVDAIPIVEKKYYKKVFTSSVGKYDLYYLFIEKALKLIKDEGALSFITPNKFCAALSAKSLRSMIFSSLNKCEIVSTSKLGVFKDAMNYPIISLMKKGKPYNSYIIRESLSIRQLHESGNFSYMLYPDEFKQFPAMVIPINTNQSEINFVLRILKKCPCLNKYLSISEGFRIPELYESASESDFKIVKQYQFEKWTPIKSGSYISINHFNNMVSSSSNRYNKIMVPKILIAEDALQIVATLDEFGHLPQGGVYFGTLITNKCNLKVILALLNSRLLTTIYSILFSGMHMGGGYLRFRTNFLEALPIIDCPDNIQNLVIKKVDLILSIKHQNPKVNTSQLETELDQQFYKLYGLTYEEITIVEAKTS